MSQSKVMSLLESTANTLSGFFVSLAVWIWIVRPIFDIQGDTETDFLITCIFTVSSIIRSYIWRRIFNRL